MIWKKVDSEKKALRDGVTFLRSAIVKHGVPASNLVAVVDIDGTLISEKTHKPKTDVVKFVKSMIRIGVQVHILTARQEIALKDTIKDLKDLGFGRMYKIHGLHLSEKPITSNEQVCKWKAFKRAQIAGLYGRSFPDMAIGNHTYDVTAAKIYDKDWADGPAVITTTSPPYIGIVVSNDV